MRRRYHITRRSDGEWQGKLENGTRASVVGETQADVISAMADIANNHGNSQVFIHRANGPIREERTYGGKDPFPPAG